MRGSLGLVAVVALVVGCSPAPESPTERPSGTAAASGAVRSITDYLDTAVRDRRFRGAVEVRRGDEVLLSRGFSQADVAGEVSNKTNTRFRIASLTKQFTAMAVLILQERGKLHVTDLVCAHLPDCPAAWRAITVEHLLTHSSGLFDYVGLSNGDPERYATVYGAMPTPEQLIQTFADRPLEFPPGTKSVYSSSGYILLGHLVELLSGQPYGRFMAENVFDPLAMSDTAYRPDRKADGRDAVGYRNWTTPATMANDAVSFSGGGLYSTVTDLARWDDFLLTGAPAVVTPDTIAQLLEPRVDAGRGVRYGYGVESRGTGTAISYFHSGDVPGFTTYNGFRPGDGLSIVVLSNLDTADATTMGENLALIAGR